ncbi:MAG: hypothetical protein WDA28_12305 [Castellaniella sp.]
MRQPRHRRARIKYGFPGGRDEILPLVDQTATLIIQYAQMARSEDPQTQAIGQAQIREIAEFCIAGQFYLADQKPKARRPRATIDTDDGGTSATAIIRSLAKQRDALGDYLKPAELWPQYIAKLDELGLSPTDDKLGVTFEGGRTTKDTFRELLSRTRRKKTKSAT